MHTILGANGENGANGAELYRAFHQAGQRMQGRSEHFPAAPDATSQLDSMWLRGGDVIELAVGLMRLGRDRWITHLAFVATFSFQYR